MLIIRLQRTGKKNRPDFRIVLAEKEAPVNKKIVEVLGSYNPRTKAFLAKEDRLKYWLDQKVAVSETVHNLFVTKGVTSEKKVKAFSIPKKPVVPVEAGAAAPAEVSAPAVETPVEIAEATAEVESKVEEKPVEIPAAEESKPIPESTSPEQPVA